MLCILLALVSAGIVDAGLGTRCWDSVSGSEPTKDEAASTCAAERSGLWDYPRDGVERSGSLESVMVLVCVSTAAWQMTTALAVWDDACV